MATYAELAGVRDDETQWTSLLQKVRVAAIVKAAAVIDSASPGATVLDWAKNALAAPESAADGVVWYVIGSNKGLALSAIYGASDTEIQNKVNDAVDSIYGS